MMVGEQAELLRQCQEVAGVGARGIGDATKRTFAVEGRVRAWTGSALMWTALIARVPPGLSQASVAGDEVPGRGEEHGTIEGTGGDWSIVPAQAAPSSRARRRRLFRRGEDDRHGAAPRAGYLERQVRGGAEADQADGLPAGDRSALRSEPVADDPGAQKRRGAVIRYRLRQADGEGRLGQHVFGVSAVDVEAREARPRAQVLFASPARLALSAGIVQPGHPGPVRRTSQLQHSWAQTASTVPTT